MMKRIAALIMSLLLIVAVLPMGASAATDTEVEQVRKNIRRHYRYTLSDSGKSSLQGYCGLLASYQLSYLGINKWAILADGRDQFDKYKDKEYTDGGHRVKPYSAADGYTLKDALNTASRNGTRDVYNILVGFQKTRTEAGSQYGHAVVIYAILNGMVYFTESYGYTLCPYAGYAASCTIEEFAEYYDSWATFEGIVVFGQKEYLDNCTEYRSNLYVQVVRPTELYTQPCSPESGEAACERIRTAARGERLQVTGLYENTLGEYFYQVQDSGRICYVLAETVKPLCFNPADISISDADSPSALTPGSGFVLAGEITATYSTIAQVHISVTDSQGNIVIQEAIQKNSGAYELATDFKPAKGFESLEVGAYTYRLYADGQCCYVQDGQIAVMEQEVTLLTIPFTVGAADGENETETQAPYNGWFLEQGVWHYYEFGAPRIGWFCYDGVNYYLRENGAVTTGWAEINGKARFFSDTGAMRTGWLTTDAGVMYLLSNGEAAHGWRTIEEKRYYFDENGIMQADSWITVNEDKYYLKTDGSAATGWVTLEEGEFYFHNDGHLLAQAVEKEEKTVFLAYDATVGSVTSLITPALKNNAE